MSKQVVKKKPSKPKHKLSDQRIIRIASRVQKQNLKEPKRLQSRGLKTY